MQAKNQPSAINKAFAAEFRNGWFEFILMA